VPYSLPALEYQVALKRTLAACKVGTGSDGQAQVQPRFEVAVEVAPRYVAGETFVADYRKLASWTKTSTLSLASHDNHTLKSVNVAARDESPEIAGQVVRGVFLAAQIAYGIPPVVAPMVPEGGHGASVVAAGPQCPEALARVDALEAQIKQLGVEIKRLTRELDRYKVAIALGTTSDADRAKIAQLTREIAAHADAVALLQADVAELSRPLALTETRLVRPRADLLEIRFPFAQGSDATEVARHVKWMSDLLGVKKDDVAATPYRGQLDVVATLSPALAAAPAPRCVDYGLAGDCQAPAQATGPAPESLAGIAWRSPVPVVLNVCQGSDADGCRSGAVRATARHEALAPQLGPLVVLPFHNGFGANNSLKVAFRQDGSMETFEYGVADSAMGRDVAATLTDALQQRLAYEQAREAKRKADEAEAAAEATSAIDTQIAALKKQKELLELQAAVDPDALAVQRELAALQAELARLQALKAIRDLGEG